MKNILKYTCLMSVGLMLTHHSVNADFAYNAPSQADYKVSQLFERSVLEAADYSANHMPVSVVLDMIAGEHVSVDLGQDLDPNTIVSFKGGRSRREILNELLTPRGFVWHFRDNTLFVRSAREIQLSNEMYGNVPTEDRYHRPVTWKVPKGIKVKKLIHEWAARARVTVDWQVERPLTVGATATFDGDFLYAVNQVLDGLHGDDVPFLHSELSSNNVLTVKAFDGVK